MHGTDLFNFLRSVLHLLRSVLHLTLHVPVQPCVVISSVDPGALANSAREAVAFDNPLYDDVGNGPSGKTASSTSDGYMDVPVGELGSTGYLDVKPEDGTM